ncbi:MAG: GspE/PulE family protein, partial [Candidatus Gracilibacteria bacterium]|nr:GspE/PulE family protein [Candidatus Gracilibacteria bacterium]
MSEIEINNEKIESLTSEIREKKVEGLKEKILENEEKKYAKSTNFSYLEAEIKKYIANQDADNALLSITKGSMDFGASDIHYETKENKVNLRMRIDGILVDIFSIENKDYKLLLERLKYESGLKLNITDIPQDGKYTKIIDNKKIDVRVSTIATKYGENVVCRVLDATKSIIDFEDLGFFWTTKRILEKAINKKNGLILVTGPTGSGKTTTLYTIIKKLNTPDKKIITLEDPIEYEVPGIVQAEVNEKKGFTFDIGLKALMRQDPDIIMVGEIRDYETLNTATNASLTGHLVLSTLHTKSAGETLDRISNMGIKPYITAGALDTIIAQRLVRKICPHCKQEVEKTSEETMVIESMLNEIGLKQLKGENIKLYRGSGCEKCNNTGYAGRIGVYEIIHLNNRLKEIIREGGDSREIIKEAREQDMISMKEDGILKAL